MPNYCNCSLTLSIEDDDPLNNNILLNFYNRNKKEDLLLSFSKEAPMPESESENWHQWCVENWGTKWEPLSVDVEENYEDISAPSLSYSFDTAWSPPLNWLSTVSTKYPQIKFFIEYSEPGMDMYGESRYTNGELTYELSSPLSLYNWSKIDLAKIDELILNKFETFKSDYEDDDDFIEDIICEYSDGEYIDNINDKVKERIDYLVNEKYNKGIKIVNLSINSDCDKTTKIEI